MTKIFAAIALATLVASPALAATTHRHHPAAMSTETSQNATAPGYYAVGPNGAAIGTDPDPFIRHSLMIEGDQNWNN